MRRVSREIGTKAGALLSRLLSFNLSTILDSCAIAYLPLPAVWLRCDRTISLNVFSTSSTQSLLTQDFAKVQIDARFYQMFHLSLPLE